MTEFDTPVIQKLQTTSLQQITSTGVLTVYEGWSIKKLSEFFSKHKITGVIVAK